MASLKTRTYRIYRATSPSGKVYIGVTCQSLERRKAAHKASAKKSHPGHAHFWDALRKYGEAMRWEILEDDILDSVEAQQAERMYIQKYMSNVKGAGYNKTDGGFVMPDPAHAKLREAGLNVTQETRHRMSLAAKGRGNLPVQMNNLRKGRLDGVAQALRGSHSSRFSGHRHSDATVDRIKNAHLHPVLRSDGVAFPSINEVVRMMGRGARKAIVAGRLYKGFTFTAISVDDFYMQRGTK